MRPQSSIALVHTLLAFALLFASPSAAAPSDTYPEAHDTAFFNVASKSFSPWKLFRSWVVTVITGTPAPPVRVFSGLEDPDRFRKAQYGNDMVLRFSISTPDEAASFAEACDTLFLDVWESTNTWVDVRLSEDVIPSLLGLLPESLQHAHVPLMHSADLLRAIGDSYPRSTSDRPGHGPFTPSLNRPGSGTHSVFFDEYRPWSVMVPWMRLMASLFPSHVRLITIGTTFEGREIQALRIGVHPTNSERPLGPRKTILVTAGSHAREWISTSTVNFIAYSLISEYGKSSTVTKMLDHFDWIFVPSLNPDGYVYSWDNDRLWRKNRQDTPLRFCRGIDLDRSFDSHWAGTPGVGNPCSENYAGEAPFGGHEARVLANWAKNQTANNIDIVSVLDLHSYSQQVLYPYAFSCGESPPGLEDLEELGEGLAKAIRHRGNTYSVISACQGNVLQPASSASHVRQNGESAGGSLLDWFYEELHVRWVYQFKLRDLGSWGFLLPKSYIVPVGEEIYDAVLFLGETLMGNEALVTKANTGPNHSDEAQRPLKSGV